MHAIIDHPCRQVLERFGQPINGGRSYSDTEWFDVMMLCRSRGLGNRVARLFRRLKLDRLAHAYTRLTGRECHCLERQAWLNKFFGR